MRHSLRFRVFLRFVMPTWLLILPCTFLMLQGTPTLAQQQNRLVLVWGGDVRATDSRGILTVRFIANPTPGKAKEMTWQEVLPAVATLDSFPIPFLETAENKTYLESLGVKAPRSWAACSQIFFAPCSNERTTPRAPTIFREPGEVFQLLAPTLRAADLAAGNVETPLSDAARMDGNRSPTQLAAIMRSAGLSLVTVANNHAFDTQEQGFLDTLRARRPRASPMLGAATILPRLAGPLSLSGMGSRLAS